MLECLPTQFDNASVLQLIGSTFVDWATLVQVKDLLKIQKSPNSTPLLGPRSFQSGKINSPAKVAEEQIISLFQGLNPKNISRSSISCFVTLLQAQLLVYFKTTLSFVRNKMLRNRMRSRWLMTSALSLELYNMFAQL